MSMTSFVILGGDDEEFEMGCSIPHRAGGEIQHEGETVDRSEIQRNLCFIVVRLNVRRREGQISPSARCPTPMPLDSFGRGVY
jgi:hypothetical protein